MKRYKLVNRARFYVFITVFLLSIFLGLLFFVDQYAKGEGVDKYETVIIQNGDTLWNIATKYNNNKYEDLREFVYIIKKENKLFGDLLVPNNILKIPKA